MGVIYISATVGAALKKLAVALLSNKKVLKTIGGIILGIVIIIIMPVIAVISIFNGDINLNTDELQQIVEQRMTTEQKEKLQLIEDTMYEIEDSMKKAKFSSRIKEAQVIYVLAFSDKPIQTNFVDKLVKCFSKNQTDEQLIAAINSEFGTQLKADEFINVMRSIRAKNVESTDYTDPSTKNNIDLVKWAIAAEKAGWGYVWGSHGDVLTESELNRLESVFGSHVTDFDSFIRKNWLGKRTADCVGLIKGYGWYDPSTGKINLGSNGMQDVTADGMYSAAKEKGNINTIPEIPGLAVWQPGHIGIYIGNGEVIEAMGTQYGVVKTKLSSGSWTHWLKVPYITYVDENKKDNKKK